MATQPESVGAPKPITCLSSNIMAVTLCHNYKMAIANAESATEQVSDVLEALGTPEHSNSYSERGKRRIEELKLFKEAIGKQENEEGFYLFSYELLCDICSCIAE